MPSKVRLIRSDEKPRMVSVPPEEADAGDQVDRVEDRLARVGPRDDLLGQDDLGLGLVGSLDPADVGRPSAGDNDLSFLGLDGTGGLGINSRRQHRRRAQQHEFLHGKLPRKKQNLSGTPGPLLAD